VICCRRGLLLWPAGSLWRDTSLERTQDRSRMHSSSSNHPSFLSPFFFFCCLCHSLVENKCLLLPFPPLRFRLGTTSCKSQWVDWKPQLLLRPSWHCAECRQQRLAQQASGDCKHLVKAVHAACRNAQLTSPHRDSHPCHLSSLICISGASKETNGDQALPR